MLRLWPVGTDSAEHTKRFFVFWKKRWKLKTKKSHNSFRKVIISNSISDVLRNLLTSKYKRPCNKPVGDRLWRPAKRKRVCTSKQLRFVASNKIFNENQALCVVICVLIIMTLCDSYCPIIPILWEKLFYLCLLQHTVRVLIIDIICHLSA